MSEGSRRLLRVPGDHIWKAQLCAHVLIAYCTFPGEFRNEQLLRLWECSGLCRLRWPGGEGAALTLMRRAHTWRTDLPTRPPHRLALPSGPWRGRELLKVTSCSSPSLTQAVIQLGPITHCQHSPRGSRLHTDTQKLACCLMASLAWPGVPAGVLFPGLVPKVAWPPGSRD